MAETHSGLLRPLPRSCPLTTRLCMSPVPMPGGWQHTQPTLGPSEAHLVAWSAAAAACSCCSDAALCCTAGNCSTSRVETCSSSTSVSARSAASNGAAAVPAVPAVPVAAPAGAAALHSGTAADLPGPHSALISCVHTAVRTNLAKNTCDYLSQTSKTNESSLGVALICQPTS